MSDYTRNAVYSRVRAPIIEQFPNAYVTSRMVAKPSSFPAILIHEVDRNRPIQNVQLDFQDVQWESVFEAQVINYLKATGLKIGLLINFGQRELQVKRLAANIY